VLVRLRWVLVTTGVALLLAGCAAADPAASPPGRAAPTAPPHAFAARVDRVVDGDTFVAVVRGERLRVRLIGVDAPESVQPDAPVECFGPESAALLAALLPPGREIRAAYQRGGRQDRFGRELWDVWLPDGRFVQAVLVRRGAARAVAYEPQVAHAGTLARLEDQARTDRRGLFAACGR